MTLRLDDSGWGRAATWALRAHTEFTASLMEMKK